MLENKEKIRYMADLEQQIHGKRLTTAQIYYHFPDYPQILQEYLWQDYDLAPEYPALHDFLDFWEISIEGKLHSVYVAHKKIITAGKSTFSSFDRSIE